MGQRHQLFVIARVAGRYRSLAAVHHQWLYGLTALQQALRILRILGAPSNRIPLQQELVFAEALFKYWGKEKPVEENEAQAGEVTADEDEDENEEKEDDRSSNDSVGDYKAAPCPFPFITTCLGIGAGSEPERGYNHAFLEEPFGMWYCQGDNNNGITLFDITDLDRVRYCFVDFAGMESKYEVELHTPLDGWDYLLAYYDETEDMVQRNIAVPTALESYDLIEVSSLADAWPKGDWQLDEDEAAGEGNTQREESSDAAPPAGSISLRDQTMASVFDAVLADDMDNLSILEEPEKLPGFQKALYDRVMKDPAAVEKAACPVQILEKAFVGKHYVDLSPFKKLSGSQLGQVIAGLPQVRSLNLSGTLVVKSHRQLEAILPYLPKLDELFLMDGPRREDAYASKAIKILAQKPELIRGRVVLSGAFSKSIRLEPWLKLGTDVAFPSFPVNQVLFTSEAPRMFEDAMCTSHEAFPLVDAMLSPTRAVAGIINALKSKLITPDVTRGNGLDLAMSVASAPPSLRDMKTPEISPIPALLYELGKRSYHSGRGPPNYPLAGLLPGQWTVLLLQDTKRKEWRFKDTNGDHFTHHVEVTCFKYALVHANKVLAAKEETVPKPDDFEIADFASFLTQTDTANEKTAEEHRADVDFSLAALEEFTVTERRDSEEGKIPMKQEGKPVLEFIEDKVQVAEHLESHFAQFEKIRKAKEERANRKGDGPVLAMHMN